MSYNYKKLLSEIPDEIHAAKFLQKFGIIHGERFCYGIKMRPKECKDRGKQRLNGAAVHVIATKAFVLTPVF